MANDPDEALIQARDSLLQRRNQLHAEIVRIETAIKSLTEIIGDEPIPKQRTIAQPRMASGPRGRGQIKPAIQQILRERAPEAIHANEVVAELRRRGLELSAKDPKATAVTAMIRMDAARRETGAKEGILKLPGNMYLWLRPGDAIPGSFGVEAPRTWPSAPSLPSEQSPDAAQE
ncbi:MAG: hypothetical protein IT304_05585 [Dehalococcoidia bacterium]|nr:hypothetical protein [Dehalococcoidia bacterium]